MRQNSCETLKKGAGAHPTVSILFTPKRTARSSKREKRSCKKLGAGGKGGGVKEEKGDQRRRMERGAEKGIGQVHMRRARSHLQSWKGVMREPSAVKPAI